MPSRERAPISEAVSAANFFIHPVHPVHPVTFPLLIASFRPWKKERLSPSSVVGGLIRQIQSREFPGGKQSGQLVGRWTRPCVDFAAATVTISAAKHDIPAYC
jgi:hypothetical protein